MKANFGLRCPNPRRLLASLLVAILVLPPMVGILGSAVSGEGWQSPWPDGRQRLILERSLLLAGVAAIGACVVGAGLALALYTQSLRVQRLWRTLLLCLAALPPYLYALAWSEMLGVRGILAFLSPVLGHPVGLAWCVFLLILAYFPLAALLVGAGLHGLDEDGLQAGRLAAPPGRYLRTVLLPLVRPYILAAGALVFLLVFVDYSVPSQLSVNTYPVEVFIAYSATLVPQGALRGLLPMIVLGPLLLALHFRMVKGRPYYQFKRPAPNGGEKSTGLLWLAGIAAAALLMGLPLLQLVKSGWPPARAWSTLVASQTAIGHSVLYATVGGILAVGMALLLLPSPFHSGPERGASVWIRSLALLPIGIPGTALGMGLIAVSQSLGWGAVARSPVLLMVGYLVMYLPFAWIVLEAFVQQIPQELYDAGALVVRSDHKKWTRIVLPLWAPGLLAAFTIVAILILRELGVAVMLAAPGVENLALRIDSFIHYGSGSAVASLALFQALLTLALFVGAAGLMQILGRAKA